MKEVIILVFGLIRSLEKSLHNLKKNIVYNNNNYNFSYIINTQCIDENEKETKIKINKIFENDNLLDIIIYNLPNQKNNNILDANYIIMKRLQKTLESLNKKYDIYINCRTDINFIHDSNINLDKYIENNIFTIIPSYLIRPCIFHNRDWDLLWIGSYKSFFIWYYSYIYGVSKVIEYINDNDFIKDNNMNLNLEYNLSISDKNRIVQKYNLIEEKTNDWWIIRDFERYDNMYHKCIKNLEDNNCIFEISNDTFVIIK
jgi:hypothetical protein